MTFRRLHIFLAAALILLMAWIWVGATAFAVNGRAIESAMRERSAEMLPPAQPGASYAVQVYWGERASRSADRADLAFKRQRRAFFFGLVLPILTAILVIGAATFVQARRRRTGPR
jgi:hypothetical protein